MKRLLIFFSKLLVLSTLMMSIQIKGAKAQDCPDATASDRIPATFSTFNWEEDKYETDPVTLQKTTVVRQAYCNTWTSLIASGNTSFKRRMGSPWEGGKGGALLAVQLAGDYKKADGWELIKFDFGGGARAVAAPYLVLYQKTTGILRVYCYVNTVATLTGLVFTLRHASTDITYSGQSAANLSIGQYPRLAPDKYLTQPSSNPMSSNEVLTYVGFFGGGQQWAMGQFNMFLDPNIKNSLYNLNALEFQVRGLIRSDVLLNGSFKFTTDYAMSGTAANSATDSNSSISAVGQKFLGSLTSLNGKLKEVNSKADAFINELQNTQDAIAKAIKAAAAKAKDATAEAPPDVKPLNLQFFLNSSTGSFSTFLGLAGSVIGLFGSTSGTGSSAFVPTSSQGTIQLTGSITVDTPLITFDVLTPGTNHFPANSSNTSIPSQYNDQLPYYDCPLGLFNLKQTPVLRKKDYYRYSTAHSDDNQFNNPYYYASDTYLVCTSYKLDAPINLVVNAASGLEVKSVKYAIAKSVPLATLTQPYKQTLTYGSYYTRDYVFDYSQVANGSLEVYPAEPGSSSPSGTSSSPSMVIMQTPFVSAGCSYLDTRPFNSLTSSPQSPIFLRVVAELIPVTVPPRLPYTGAPILYSQDYAVDLVDDANFPPYNRILAAGELPPYNLQTYKPGNKYGTSLNVYSAVDITEPQKVKNDQLVYGSSDGSAAEGEVANSILTFTNSSSIYINRTSPNRTVILRAQDEVQIQGQLTSPSGNNDLVITTSLSEISNAANVPKDCTISATTGGQLSVIQGGTVSTFSSNCGYQSTATSRMSGAVTTQPSPPLSTPLTQLVAYPNPANSSTTVQLTVPNDECIERIELISISGQVSWYRTYQCEHSISVEVPLTGLKGIYLLKATTSKQNYISKLSVE